MSSFVIEGGHRMRGEITPQGAKNEALEVICATLLTSEKVEIRNVPDILDVANLIRLLADMGVKVEHVAKGAYTFQADAVDLNSGGIVARVGDDDRAAVGTLRSGCAAQRGR